MASAVASVLGAVVGNGGGGLFDGVAKLVDAIKGKNPEDAAKLAELLQKHNDLVLQTDADLAKAKINENIQLNQIAGENVRADATSGDKYTSRARPSIIYVGLVIFLCNYVFIALLQRLGYKPVELPSYFWETWGIVATGVVMTRTVDKLFGGAGGTVKLPFGVHVESKGD